MEDTVTDIYRKYINLHRLSGNPDLLISDDLINHIYNDVLKLDKPVALFASRFDESPLRIQLEKMDGYDRKMALKKLVCPDVERILGY